MNVLEKKDYIYHANHLGIVLEEEKDKDTSKPEWWYGNLNTITVVENSYKKLVGNLNHITLHPRTITNRQVNNNQRINLHLNNSQDEKKIISGMERSDNTEDPLLYLFIDNSVLGSMNNEYMTAILLGRNLGEIKNYWKIAVGKTFTNISNSTGKAE